MKQFLHSPERDNFLQLFVLFTVLHIILFLEKNNFENYKEKNNFLYSLEN